MMLIVRIFDIGAPKIHIEWEITNLNILINAWAGIIGDHLIRLFFIDGNLNSEMYETMLIERIIPAIQNLFPNDFDCVWFQQDEAPAHFGREDCWMKQLSRTDGFGGMEQLSGLQDLLIWCHLIFLWEFLKERVYKTKPASMEKLKQRITEMSLITVEKCQKYFSGFSG